MPYQLSYQNILAPPEKGVTAALLGWIVDESVFIDYQFILMKIIRINFLNKNII